MIDSQKKRFRFSLRFLLVLTLGAGLAASYVAYEIRLAEFEQEQLKKLELLGEVSATYHYQFNSEGSVDPQAQPKSLANWLRVISGERPLHRGVRWLSISNEDSPELSDDQLAEIKTALSHFTRLETFSSDVYPWKDLDAFENATGLKHLSIAGEPTNIEGIKRLTQLEGLILGDVWQLQDISPLANCTQLRSLDLRGCDFLKDFQPLNDLRNLEYLDLSHSLSLNSLKGVEQLTNLTRLELRDCSNLADISDLSSLEKLTSLSITFADSSCDFSTISQLDSLQQLRLTGNKQITPTMLSELVRLEKLTMEECGFKTLDGLESLRELESLFLAMTPVEDASAVFALPKLTFLSVAGTKLTDEQIQELKRKLPKAYIAEMLGF